MKLVGRLAGLPLRTRLTALYGVAFLAAGAVLVALIYGILAVRLESQPSVADQLMPTQLVPGPSPGPSPNAGALSGPDVGLTGRIVKAEEAQRDQTLQSVLWQSLVAFLLVGSLAVVASFQIAGRALRPLTQITATARRVAERSLHERIALDGPRDEVKELADTFDQMLERLDRSFNGQRHFVGNASHELRTPLAVERTLLEVALADPHASEDLKAVGEVLLETNARTERLIDKLLTLARSEQEPGVRREADLADLVRAALATCEDEIGEKGLVVEAQLADARVVGDVELLEQVALNVVQNAVRHNEAGGSVWVRTSSDRDLSIVEVSNTGPAVGPHDVERMFEPFVRLARERVGSSQGLGLSIVRSVVGTHGGEVTAVPRAGGGLTIRIALPQSPPHAVTPTTADRDETPRPDLAPPAG